MASTVFNPIQQHLLKMFAYDSSEEHLLEIKQVLTEYLARRVDQEMNQLWDEGKISEETIESWGKEHMRTPYRVNH